MLNEWNVYEYIKGNQDLDTVDFQNISEHILIEGILDYVETSKKENPQNNLKYPFPSKKSLRKLEKYKIVDLAKRMRTLHNHSKR